jgi:hypothetical protein
MNRYIENRLDILNFFKYQNILDKIRFLLLNEEQNILLDFIKSPNLATEKDLIQLKDFENDKIITDKLYEVFSKNTVKLIDKKLDEKLMNLIDPKLLKIIYC